MNRTRQNIGFLFDLDGVIIDSEKTYTLIWREINRIFPTGVPDMEYRIKGMTLHAILSQYFPSHTLQEKVVRILYEKEKQMKYHYTEGAAALLEKLRQADIPTALVTSSNDQKMARLWHQLPELKDFFDVIIDGSQVVKSKPDPEGYLRAAAALGIKPERCAVLEDSLQGATAGRCSGAFVIGVVGTLSADILQPECDILVDSLARIDLNDTCNMLNTRNDG